MSWYPKRQKQYHYQYSWEIGHFKGRFLNIYLSLSVMTSLKLEGKKGRETGLLSRNSSIPSSFIHSHCHAINDTIVMHYHLSSPTSPRHPRIPSHLGHPNSPYVQRHILSIRQSSKNGHTISGKCSCRHPKGFPY